MPATLSPTEIAALFVSRSNWCRYSSVLLAVREDVVNNILVRSSVTSCSNKDHDCFSFKNLFMTVIDPFIVPVYLTSCVFKHCERGAQEPHLTAFDPLLYHQHLPRVPAHSRRLLHFC